MRIGSSVLRGALWKEAGGVKERVSHPCAPFSPAWAPQRKPCKSLGDRNIHSLGTVSLESSAAVRGIEQGLHTEAEDRS